MTSMAMIMRYHGLTTMPDGQPVNSESVNNWLKSQADGYIGNGLVNWQAGTRLTRLISEKFGTVKLEYGRRDGSSLEPAKTEIAAKKPVVLQIDGHFLVGDGVTADQNDLLIKDPAFNYARLAEHQKPLLSTRLFQPSHTDLSYLLITHRPGLTIKLKGADGQVVKDLETFQENISNHSLTQPERTPALFQHQLAKPTSGTYTLELTAQTAGEYEVAFYAYPPRP